MTFPFVDSCCCRRRTAARGGLRHVVDPFLLLFRLFCSVDVDGTSRTRLPTDEA